MPLTASLANLQAPWNPDEAAYKTPRGYRTVLRVMLGIFVGRAQSLAVRLMLSLRAACRRSLLAELNDYQLRDIGLVGSGVVAHPTIPARWACPCASIAPADPRPPELREG
jgi:hypothetical protein